MKDPYTLGYYLNSFDLQYGFGKEVVQQPENRRIYKTLWMRTLMISVIVTLACLALGYPVAHLLATLPLRYSNLLMICVLMPFWTSLLVRIVAWMIMLQQEGVVNDTLVWLRLVGDESRWQMMYNFTGTGSSVMTQILLPFMILPVYSVMKGISPAYMKAAQNLGAPPAIAFLRVYVPQSLPGGRGGRDPRVHRRDDRVLHHPRAGRRQGRADDRQLHRLPSEVQPQLGAGLGDGRDSCSPRS